jgi:hypothetical protein
MTDPSYIPLASCKHGFLYRLDSRNLRYGVFNEKTKGFMGIRRKFTMVFLFEEYHWDTGEPYGTVKPLEELEDISNILDDPYKLEVRLLKLEVVKLTEENWNLQKKLMQ